MAINDEEFEKGKAVQEGDEDLCRAMWLAVIVQALIDATGNPRNEWDKLEARRWLEGRNCSTSDFAAVCDLAGIDSVKTGRLVTKILEGKLDCIDFRCSKKANLKNRSNESRRRYFARADRNACLRRQRIYDSWRSGGRKAANDNLPEPSNDNFNNQPMEKNV